jgi:hypothetical protein
MPEQELVLKRCQSESWSCRDARARAGLCRDAKSVVFVSVVRIEDVVVVVSDVVVELEDVVVFVSDDVVGLGDVVVVVKSDMRSPKLIFAARSAQLKCRAGSPRVEGRA